MRENSSLKQKRKYNLNFNSSNKRKKEYTAITSYISLKWVLSQV